MKNPFPELWTHKKNKKEVRAMPWWEMIDSVIDEKEFKIPEINVPYKFGMLIQVGWLLENEHGVWLGVGPKAAEEFTRP